MANKKKLATAAVAVAAAAAILLGGTFAWQSISQTALNEASDVINPGGRLHDDFDGTNKDVYVENFTDPENGGEDIFARIRLDEYFEIVMNKNTPAEKTEVIVGGTKDDTSTYATHYFDVEDAADAYWDWLTGGSTTYMPTFNKDKDSLKADINGTYDGLDADDDIHYDDYVDAPSVGDEKTDYALYDGDTDNLDNDGATEVEETHYAAETLGATLMSMQEWIDAGSQPGPYWVYDTDGWVYWAQAIEPGTATGLLLDGIELNQVMDDTWYYAINVVAQFVTADDVGKTDGTGFYADADHAPSTNAEALLEAIGVDMSGEADDSTATAFNCAVTLTIPDNVTVDSKTFPDGTTSYTGVLTTADGLYIGALNDTIKLSGVNQVNKFDYRVEDDNGAWVSGTTITDSDGQTIAYLDTDVSGNTTIHPVNPGTAEFALIMFEDDYDEDGNLVEQARLTITIFIEEADSGNNGDTRSLEITMAYDSDIWDIANQLGGGLPFYAKLDGELLTETTGLAVAVYAVDDPDTPICTVNDQEIEGYYGEFFIDLDDAGVEFEDENTTLTAIVTYTDENGTVTGNEIGLTFYKRMVYLTEGGSEYTLTLNQCAFIEVEDLAPMTAKFSTENSLADAMKITKDDEGVELTLKPNLNEDASLGSEDYMGSSNECMVNIRYNSGFVRFLPQGEGTFVITVTIDGTEYRTTVTVAGE